MKQRTVWVAAIAILVGGFGVYNISKPDTTYANLQVVSGDAAFEKFQTIDQLEQYSDLVVIATFTGEREMYVRNDENGNPLVKLSKSTVEIEKVLKGDAQKKGKITVFEDSYIADNGHYITTEHYKWMNKDGKYLLFLYSQPLNDTYVITSLYQGKYDLSLKDKAKEQEDSKKAFLDPTAEFMGHGFELEDFYKMKDQAKKKYGL